MSVGVGKGVGLGVLVGATVTAGVEVGIGVDTGVLDGAAAISEIVGVAPPEDDEEHALASNATNKAASAGNPERAGLFISHLDGLGGEMQKEDTVEKHGRCLWPIGYKYTDWP